MAHPGEGVPRGIRVGGAGSRPLKGDAAFRAYFSQRPSDLQRAKIAEVLGCHVDEVPDYFETLWDLIVYAVGEKAVRGSEWAMGEILDRLSPKPRRMEVSGPDGGPVRGAISTSPPSTEEAAASAAYYAALQRSAAGEEA